MPAQVSLRALSPDEKDGLDTLARSRSASAPLVERARIVHAAAESAAGFRITKSREAPTSEALAIVGSLLGMSSPA
jgi:hypothetical protein